MITPTFHDISGKGTVLVPSSAIRASRDHHKSADRIEQGKKSPKSSHEAPCSMTASAESSSIVAFLLPSFWEGCNDIGLVESADDETETWDFMAELS
jgi:hypothetical protein